MTTVLSSGVFVWHRHAECAPVRGDRMLVQTRTSAVRLRFSSDDRNGLTSSPAVQPAPRVGAGLLPIRTWLSTCAPNSRSTSLGSATGDRSAARVARKSRSRSAAYARWRGGRVPRSHLRAGLVGALSSWTQATSCCASDDGKPVCPPVSAHLSCRLNASARRPLRCRTRFCRERARSTRWRRSGPRGNNAGTRGGE